jgi:hypothetical protein
MVRGGDLPLKHGAIGILLSAGDKRGEEGGGCAEDRKDLGVGGWGERGGGRGLGPVLKSIR